MAAIRDPDPVLFLEHKLPIARIKGEYPEGEFVLPIGPADVKRAGKDLTVVSYGMTMHYALQAAEELSREEGIEAEVIDLRTLLPLDRRTIVDSVKKTGKLLVVHEDNLTGGVGAEVAATVADEAFMYLDAPDPPARGPDIPRRRTTPLWSRRCCPARPR